MGARAKAFTLVELVMAAAVLAIIAAIAIPRVSSSLANHRVQAAANRIVADLARAQALARSGSRTQTVTFDAVAHEYQLVGSADALTNTPHRVALNDPTWQVRILSVDFGGDSALIFDGFGTPDSGGTVVIESGGIQRTITVDPATGKATIS